MLEVTEVRVNGLQDPTGLDQGAPLVITWKLESDREGCFQNACRLQILDGQTAVYDSGIAASAKEMLTYAGKLKSLRRYRVVITAEDNHGQRAENAQATFVLGKKAGEWSASWIGVQEEDRPKGQETLTRAGMVRAFQGMMSNDPVAFTPDRELTPVQIFRKTFSTSKVLHAYLSITAKGLYEARINDQPVTDTCLNPGFTAYDKEFEYQTFDVTSLVREGENVFTCALADGWYRGKYGILGFGNNYGPERALLCEIDLFTAQGQVTICSDGSFTYTGSPILYADLLIGEKQDTRVDPAKLPSKPARVLSDPIPHLVGQRCEMVRQVDTILHPTLLRTPDGDLVADFHQNMVGIVELSVHGHAGDVIRLQHSEVLDENGCFFNNVDGVNRDQTDEFILNGTQQVLRAHFTFHGFRYVRLSGDTEGLTSSCLRGIVLGTDLRRTGTFSCSDPDLNRLYENTFWSQRGNMLSVPTDCPQRERAGWTGDIQVYRRCAAYEQDVDHFLSRWLSIARLEQFEDGEIPVVVPYPYAYSAMQKDLFGSDTSAGWADAVVMVPWTLYNVYDDEKVLSDNYDMMTKWLAYCGRQAPTGLWTGDFHFGDWLYPSCKNAQGESDMFRSAKTTKEYVATCEYAMSTETMAKIADILGKKEDAAKYRSLNQKIREAYAARYISSDGTIGTAPQGVYVLTLAMKMAAEETLQKVAAHLDQMIHENGDRLDTGFLSVPYLLDVLMDYGYTDTAKALLYQRRCPSWLYEVDNGATTVWERWDAITESGKRQMSSFNHYAFGCVGDFMVRRLLGLTGTAPGYRTFTVAPDFSFGLSHAEGTFDSIHGPIRIAWQIRKEEGRLQLQVPAGTTAMVKLPGVETVLTSGSYEINFSGKEAER